MVTKKSAKSKKVERGRGASSDLEQISHLSVRVPTPYKNYWHAQVVQEGRSMKDVIIEMFTERYGLP